MNLDLQCPVCGFSPLDEPAYKASGGGSYEICPSCNFEYGFDDDDQGFTFEQWRARWVERGMPWGGDGEDAPPEGWDPVAQLASLDHG